MKFISNSEKETLDFAEKFAYNLKKGSVVFLNGEMGCGKTVFTKGLLKGLGYKDEVTSPTFAICHRYDADIPVLHYDLYRLDNYDDAYSTGLFDDCGENNIAIIEWSGLADEYFPDAVRINFEYGSEPDERIITVE